MDVNDTTSTIDATHAKKPNKTPSIKLANEADNATLAFFTNPAYLGLLKRKLQPNNKDESDAEVIKFYRKRIISLFKDLFKSAEEQSVTAAATAAGRESAGQELKETHLHFVMTAIKHFEMVDTKDIVQGQHIIDIKDIKDIKDNNSINPEDILDAIGGEYTLDEANDLMMRKTFAVPNLDNYVISKPDLSANNVRIIPVKFDIDLKAPELKTKGLKTHVKKSKEDKENKSKNNKEELSQ